MNYITTTVNSSYDILFIVKLLPVLNTNGTHREYYTVVFQPKNVISGTCLPAVERGTLTIEEVLQ